MVKKSSIIITSLGRTGTKFFASLFANVIPDCTALHEPDVLGIERDQGIQDILRQVREGGLYNMTIRKALGDWSLIELSDKRMMGRLTRTETVRRLVDQRERFVNTRPGSVYVESNSGYYGVVDLLEQVYEQYRVVYIVRNGRDWVRSRMDWGEAYNKGPIRSLVAHTWPTALEVPGDEYQHLWPSMSRFEKLCWAWSRLNEYALKQVEANDNARLFFFEDIFHGTKQIENLSKLIQFTTSLPALSTVDLTTLASWIDRKIHRSSGKFPQPQNWTAAQKQQFKLICGPLMEKLSYSYDTQA